MRILLIEDDPETAAHVEDGLRKSGHSVDRVADGREALSLATLQCFDLMIVDRMLPGLDGLTLVKMIRAGGIGTPVLFLSRSLASTTGSLAWTPAATTIS